MAEFPEVIVTRSGAHIQRVEIVDKARSVDITDYKINRIDAATVAGELPRVTVTLFARLLEIEEPEDG